MLRNKIYQLHTPATRTPSSASHRTLVKPLEMNSTRFTTDAQEPHILSHRKSKSHLIFNNEPVIRLLEQQYIQGFKNENLRMAVDSLVEVMLIEAKKDDIIRLLNVYLLIGDTYRIFAQFSSAITVYSQVLVLCDIFNENQKAQDYKVQAFQRSANIAQYLKLYSTAVRIYKKILQYSWFTRDKTTELQCYDKLGILAYLQGDLDKADYYHQRAVSGRCEAHNTNHYEISNYNIQQHFKKLPKGVQHIDQALLSKATFLPFVFNDTIIRQPHRFNCLLPPEQAFEKIFSLQQFDFEISTPRQAKQGQRDHENVSPTELFLSVIAKSKDPQERNYFKKLSHQQKHNLYHNVRKKTEVKYDQGVLKRSLEKQISERLQYKETYFEDKYKVSRMNKMRTEIRDRVNVQHLSPNRDLFAYPEAFLLDAQPDKLFINVL